MRRIAALSAVVLLTIGLAACGDDDDDGGTVAADDTEETTTTEAEAEATTTTAAEEEPAEAEIMLAVAETSLGETIVDPDGLTVYMFQPDTLEASACTDGCAEAWPAVLYLNDATTGDGLDATLLGTAPYGDDQQVTYNGHRLYLFSGDAAPGDTNGQGVGDVWWALDPAGEPIS